MVRTFVRSFLLLSLLMSPLYAGPQAYFSEGFRDTVIALHESKPGQKWSADFNKVCDMIKHGEIYASSEQIKRVVDECMRELSCHNSPEARALIATMEAYKNSLNSGAAVVSEEDAKNDETHVNRRKKCKTFNRLIVRCLLNVLGNATFAGDVSIAGSLTAGPTTLSSLTVTGGSTFIGPVTIGGVPITGAVLGYGYAATTTAGTVAIGADVILPNQGPSLNVTYGTSGTGTTLILPAGTYAFVYTVSGANATAADGIDFSLFNTTAGAVVPNAAYNSGSVSGTGLINGTVSGVALATFGVTSAISLRNTSGAAVTLTAATGSGAFTAAPNLASVAAIRLS